MFIQIPRFATSVLIGAVMFGCASTSTTVVPTRLESTQGEITLYRDGSFYMGGTTLHFQLSGENVKDRVIEISLPSLSEHKLSLPPGSYHLEKFKSTTLGLPNPAPPRHSIAFRVNRGEVLRISSGYSTPFSFERYDSQARLINKDPGYVSGDAQGATANSSAQQQASPRAPEPFRGTMVLSASASAPDPNGVVILSINTGTDTASLRINGDEEGGKADGRYSVTRFARIGSNQFEIIATDRLGVSLRQTVSVNRQVADSTVQFSKLNPLNVRPRPPRDAVAIIIGIQDYRRVPKADFANNDARVFYDYAVRGLGIRGENIKMLLDQEADEVGILSALKNWLPLKVKKNQTEVFVFYSGHGLPSNDGASLFLLPHGVDRQFLERTAINQTELVAALQSPQPRSVTLFLDACYSGQTRAGEMLLASARPIVVQAKASSFPANFTVISASAPEELASSSPELKHGIFSYWLMKGMEGEADINKDGQITAAELREYLSDSVGRMSAAQGRLQRPQAAGELNRVVVQR